MHSWIEDARRPVLDVAAALGVPADPGRGMACPACGEERRDRKRGAVGLRKDGAGWRCHKCGATGDGIDLAAWSLEGRRLRELDADAQQRVRVWFVAQGWSTTPAAPTTAPSKPTVLVRPPQDEVQGFWAASQPLTAARDHDTQALAFLRERGLEPALDAIASADLARLSPARNGTPWPAWWPAGRAHAWRLLVPAFDARGVLTSLHARAVEPMVNDQGEPMPRQLWPGSRGGTRYDAAGLFFADPAALAMMRGEVVDGLHTLLICEGLTDWLAAAAWCRVQGRDDLAVLGGVAGSFPALSELSIPLGVRVLAAVDADPAGDRYFAQIHQALPRAAVQRLLLPKGSGDLCDFLAAGGDLAPLLETPADTTPDQEPKQPPTPAPAPLHGVFLLDGCTWEADEDNGPRLLVPYALHFERDVSTPEDRYLEGEIRLPRAAAIPFELPSELLGDMRALNKTLARLMGSHYRVPPAQKQRQILNAWLSTAEGAEQVELLHDYGFAHDGRSFVDHSGTLPEGIRSFRAPAHMAAARLNLEADGAPPPAELAASLLDLWPRVLGCPATVSALMGIVGWGLVAPVLEANNPGVSPLLAFIVGRSGAGKSTHACVVQCFFGDYRDTKCALPFSSTPLAIELESHFFRGAVMVVGDVKSSAIVQGRHAQVLGLIQRAGDRAKRYRLQATGQADHARASRATWLLEGEDVPVTDSSALARMLQLRLPEVTKVPALADELEQLLLYLPTLTRALVLHLLATQPWARLGARYRSLSQALTELAGTASNGVRLAKHIAAVVVGAEVWSSFLATLGLALPADSDALVQHLVVMGHEQLGELEEATPGERFLELLRQLLAGGLAQLGEHEDGGEVVGQWSEDGRIAYLLPAPALGLLRRHFPDAAAGLPPPASIAADLARKDALAETDQGRRTKKARVGGRSVNTWALRGELVRG